MSAFKPKSNDGKRLSKPSTKQSNELLLGEEVVEFLPTPELFNLYKLNGYDPHIRAIFINDDINEDTAYHFISSVNTILKYENTTEPIKLFVNSYGGDVYDMFWIIDTMNTLAKNGILVDTIGCGKIMSAGAFITISGTGKRYVYPNTSIMLHEIQSIVGLDNSSKIKDSVMHNDIIEENIFKLLSSKTKKNIEYWKKVLSYKDVFYTPEQAKSLGLIDGIIGEDSPVVSQKKGVNKPIKKTNNKPVKKK